MKIRIGVGLGASTADSDAFVETVQHMEACRFDSLWLSEVLTTGVLDPLGGLAFAAGITRKLKLGTTMTVTGRNPVRLAKELATIDRLSHRSGALGHGASLLKVFWPYLDWNTVFDNSRVVAELGEAPAKFSSYAYPLLKFSRANKFHYPAKPWPSSADAAQSSIIAGSAHA